MNVMSIDEVINGLKCISGDVVDCKTCGCHECDFGCKSKICVNAINLLQKLLKKQEARVMTLEEVVTHYSLPPVLLDDLDWQLEYLSNIKPLYFEYKRAQNYPDHWRNQREAQHCLDHWTELYGKLWRCWTSMPTDEQRKEVKWDA